MIILSVLGRLPKLDAVITADTQWERRKTYETFAFYKKWFEDRGLHVETVTAGNIRTLGAREHIHIPFFTATGGPLRRQCTLNFKIVPIKHAARRLAGFHPNKPPHPKPGQFENWLGISWDEWDRMKTSQIKYIINRYPLVENKINRWDCEAGFQKLGLPVPIKSACIGCPYRAASSWLEMQENDPDEFADAVQFDRENRHNPLALRANSTADQLFVWRGLIPLEKVDFAEEAKKERQGKQAPLVVCTGEYCWT